MLRPVVLIHAEFAAFADAERNFQQALREFESALDNLERDLGESLALWEGDAKTAYVSARARWNQGARDLSAELARLRRAIGRAHQNYRSASSTNVRMWSG